MIRILQLVQPVIWKGPGPPSQREGREGESSRPLCASPSKPTQSCHQQPKETEHLLLRLDQHKHRLHKYVSSYLLLTYKPPRWFLELGITQRCKMSFFLHRSFLPKKKNATVVVKLCPKNYLFCIPTIFLPQLFDIFTQIYLPYLWHYATLNLNREK